MHHADSCYITTPIYYVNDRPHIGHCYTTLLADALARFERLRRGSGPISGPGAPQVPAVFLLTGTDEHAEKVVTSAAAHGLSPKEWADRNAAQFRLAFEKIGIAFDDFMRTSQARHTSKVLEYIRELQRRGHIYLGDYSGWFDPSQEEYVTESAAKESPKGPYTSPVTGVPLVKRTEKNYFFRLSAFAEKLRAHIDANPAFILPEARRNEVLGRLRDGLGDIPVSRPIAAGDADWGVRMPDDPNHRVYVWIDALFNYLSAVDTPERRHLWPPRAHLLGKDILWFHAVIWPSLLMALDRPLPGAIVAHSFWVREGVKMSKSLGNFVTLELLLAYAQRYSLDAVRWYLLTQGPQGNTDADFSHAKFVEVYNADLANGIGNCASRVANMIDKYFAGRVPEHHGVWAQPSGVDWREATRGLIHNDGVLEAFEDFEIERGLKQGVRLVAMIDNYISETRPFSIAKEMGGPGDAKRKQLETILYHCAEGVRLAALLLSPAMPSKMSELLSRWGSVPEPGVPLEELAAFGGPHAVKPGATIAKGEALFMRADPAEAAPTA